MQFLGILALVCWLAAFVGGVWLVVVAFKKSPLWGVCVFFLSPIAAIIFAIKNWEDSKKPFLIYMGSMVAGFSIMMITLASLGGMVMKDMAQQMQEHEAGANQLAEIAGSAIEEMDPSVPAAPPQGAQLRNDEAGNRPDATADGAMVMENEIRREGGLAMTVFPDASSSKARPASHGSGSATVSVREAHNYVGELMAVVTKGGREYDGRLIQASDEELRFDRNIRGGSFTIDMKKSDVRSLRLIAP